MKKYSLLFLLLAFACNAFSQVYQPEHWDGYLSIKVKNESNVSIDEFFGEGIHAQFDTLIASFGIYRIEHSFLDTTSVSLRNCSLFQF